MKKLLMVMAMCLAFCAVAVNAEGRKWEKVPDQQKVYDDNRQPISVNIENGDGDNENKIKITLPPGWSVWFEKDGKTHNPLKINNDDLTKHQQREENNGSSGWGQNTSPRVVIHKDKDNQEKLLLGSVYNDNHSESGLPITVTVAPPSDNKDKLTVSFQGGGFYAGSVYLWDSEALAEAKQKAEDEKMEDMYLEYVNYDNSKTWYQRLGDGIRDQWWNFTGMFY
ncbi:hypothetical protein [Streptococcus halichoeri]|uniref:hypothetical protein n=1 Tax=Streptococcus halichoeri TaxID=254785 RepID=UPI00135C7EB4|nr:hypothetical protein [Streptococcus halichoeri]